MARNEEKSHSMMNRWTTFTRGIGKVERGPRPYLASNCKNLQDCQHWRGEILFTIGRKVQDIQNEGLGEHMVRGVSPPARTRVPPARLVYATAATLAHGALHHPHPALSHAHRPPLSLFPLPLPSPQLRDLNDEINKLIREKRHWERQIKSLGGPSYKAAAIERDEGSAAPGNARYQRGYMYFGAAKKLPGVKELFAKKKPKPKKRTRYQMYKAIDPEYYGYNDEDEAAQLVAEQQVEDAKLTELDERWHERKRRRRARITREREERAAEQLASGSAATGAAAAAAAAAAAGLAPAAAATKATRRAPERQWTHSFDDGSQEGRLHRRGGGGAGEDEGGDEETGLAGESDGEGDDLADLVGLTAGTAGMKALVSVPTQLAMEAELIARKKAMLMKMFVDDDEETEE